MHRGLVSGPGSASSVVITTATVLDVLRIAEAEIVHFQADQSVRNLPQVKKGDEVTAASSVAKLDRVQVGHLVEATYREAVSISVQKPGK
jgi:hypothetical protein